MGVRDDGGVYTVEVYDPKLRRTKYVGRVLYEQGRKREAREEAESMFRQAREQTRKHRAKKRFKAEEFADFWLENFPRPGAATREKYGYALRGFKEHFAGRWIDEIQRHEAHAWAAGVPRGTVRVVAAMFSDAHDKGYVLSNPFSGLRLPASRGRKDLDPRDITPELVDALCEAAKAVHGDYGCHFACMIRFAAYTGMRVGELMALKWEDIDVAAEEIHIRHHTDATGQVVAATKMGHRPTVVLFPEARAALPERILGLDFVFHNQLNRRFKKGAHYHSWHPVRSRVRPGMDFHELRHLCATWMLDNGASYEQVALQLGHIDKGGRPNVHLVQTVYGHPDLAREREALKKLFRKPKITPIDRKADTG